MTQPHNTPEDDATVAAGTPRPSLPRTIASAADLEESLFELQLLDTQQQTELINLRSKFTEPKQLARELIQRDWLTPFQVNQLFQGKGNDLSLGPFVLLERIGEGGMGAVYKARHKMMKRIVAIKLIRKDRLANPDVVQRFYREFEAAGKVVHPNVVVAHHADRIGEVHFLVMEYVEGGDLAKEVKKRGPLPIADACDHIRQAALGLQHAHKTGLVHRDIKPGNLLLSHGVVKILDLGLARLSLAGNDQPAGELTHEGAIMGTPDYIAPEQAQESHTVDGRADIYSLGCTLYYLLTAKVPFPGGTLMQKMMKHQRETPPPLQGHRPEVPAGLVAVVARMMAKNPEERYQSGAEVASALEAFCGTHPPAAIPLGGITAVPAAIPVATASPIAQAIPLARAQALTASPPLAVPLAPGAADAGSETLPPSSADSSPSWTGYILKKLKLPHRPERRLWLLAGTGAGLLLLVLVVVLLRPVKEPETPKTGLDAFEAKNIPAENIINGQPKYLVGVLGEHRIRNQGLAVSALAIRPDGKWAATVTQNGILRLVDPETLVERMTFSTGQGGVTCLAFSPDGKYLAAGTLSGAIRLCDVDAGKELDPLRDGHKGPVNQVVFSPKDDILLSASSDTTVGVWDYQDHKLLRSFTQHTTPVLCVAVSTDGRHALSSAGTLQGEKFKDSEPRLWEVGNAKQKHPLPLPSTSRAFAVAFQAGGLSALTFDNDMMMRWWDPDGMLKRTEAALRTNATTIALSSNGRHFLTSDNLNSSLTLWETSTGRQLIRSKLPAHGTGVFMPDNRRVLFPFDDTLRMWDTITDKELLPMKGPTRPVTLLSLHKDNRILISACSDGMHRWDLETQSGQYIPAAAGVRHAVSPSGSHALSIESPPPRINFIELEKGRVVRPLQTADLLGSFVEFLDDEQAIYDVADGFVAVRDMKKDRETTRYEIAPKSSVLWIVPSPDGKLWFCKAGNGTVILWDRDQNKRAAQWSGDVTCAAFSSDSKQLYCGYSSADVRVFDLPYAEEKSHTYFRLHKSAVNKMALTPDGKRLVTSDANGHVVIWDTTVRGDNKIDEWDHPCGINSLLFADDRHLFVGNSNTTIYILRLPR